MNNEKKIEKDFITLSLTSDLKLELKNISNETGIPISSLIRVAILEYLKGLNK